MIISFQNVCLFSSLMLLALSPVHAILDKFNTTIFIPPEWQRGASQVYPAKEFSFTYGFFVGLIFVPALLAVIGIFLLLSYQISLCCRPCFRRCCPNRCTCLYVKDKSYLKGDFNTRLKYHKCAIISFIVFLTITLVFSICMILPYQFMDESLNSISTGLVDLYIFFSTIISDATIISDNIGQVDTYVLAKPCYQAFGHYNLTRQVLAEAALIQFAINRTLGKVGNIPVMILDANDLVNNTVQPVLRPVFWGYFGVVLGIILMWSLVLLLCRSKKYLTFMIILTEVVVLILSIVYAVELYVVLMNASFCFPSPSTHVLNAFSKNDKVYDTIDYYTTCQGM